jgi:hypothetical protein
LHFSLPVSRWSLPDSVIEFHDPENTKLAVGNAVLSFIEAEIYVHPGLAAAILNLSIPVSTEGLRSLSDGANEFSDPENMEIVSKIYFVT